MGKSIVAVKQQQLARVQREAAKARDRMQKAAAKVSRFDRVALFDGSGSMGTADAFDRGGLPSTRWHALHDAWTAIAPLAKGRLAAFVFSDDVVPVKGSATGRVLDLPYQGGSTGMCEALRTASRFQNPRRRVLLVSDGEPTDGDPLPIAAVIGCPVDTVFVGSPSGTGKDLLREIARVTGGEFLDMAGKFDAAKFLEHSIRVLRLDEGA